MKAEETLIPDVILFTPRRLIDSRGYFMELFCQASFRNATSSGVEFVQENQSLSLQANTIRGLHFQGPPYGQGKLVRCVKGSILDVVVDIRRGSPSLGRYIVKELSSKNDRQLWIPAGFMHGFRTLEDNTIVSYKCTQKYAPDCEGAVLWNDPDLGIDWGIEAPSSISRDDSNACRFSDFVSPFEYSQRTG